MKPLNLIQKIKLNKKGSYDTSEWQVSERISNETNFKTAVSLLKGLKDFFKTNKIKYIVAGFSGGHDEGGFNGYEFQDENHNKIENLKHVHCVYTNYDCVYEEREGYKYYYEINHWVYTESDLINIENEFLYKYGFLNEYGSFAGDYSVDGEITINVETGDWDNTARQTIEEYEEISNNGNIFNDKEPSKGVWA